VIRFTFQKKVSTFFYTVCHHNSLLIYGSLRTPTLDRFARVTHVSTLLSLVSCMTLAVSGYLVFTNKTQGNILNNFPEVRTHTCYPSTLCWFAQKKNKNGHWSYVCKKDDTMINVARFAFGLNMFTTLPLELFVCREVCGQEFHPSCLMIEVHFVLDCLDSFIQVIEQFFFSHESFNMQRHLFFTSVILFSSMFSKSRFPYVIFSSHRQGSFLIQYP